MLSTIYKEVAEELGLDEKLVRKTYSGYWLFVKTILSSLPIKEDITEEDFSKLRTSVNIPHIGKLAVLKDKLFRKKKLHKSIQEKYVKNKED